MIGTVDSYEVFALAAKLWLLWFAFAWLSWVIHDQRKGRRR